MAHKHGYQARFVIQIPFRTPEEFNRLEDSIFWEVAGQQFVFLNKESHRF